VSRTAVERLRTTLGLHDAGVALMRQNLRRAHPDADERELDRLLQAWVTTRPGARDGDGDGHPVDLDHLR
jgi:hypothetical protein